MANANKRHAPITFENSPPKHARQNQGNGHSKQRQPYVVPSGKFSAKVSHGHGAGSLLSTHLGVLNCKAKQNLFSFQILVLADVVDTGEGGVTDGAGINKATPCRLVSRKRLQ